MVSTTDNRERNVHSRVEAVLKGEKPDRVPFIDRIELWYSSHIRAGTLPEEFRGAGFSPAVISSDLMSLPREFTAISLTDVHRAVGIGQQLMTKVFGRRLHGVELTIKVQNETVYRELNPLVDHFPRLYGILPVDKPGVAAVEIITPVGKLNMRSKLVPEMIQSGTVPFMVEHPIKNISDFRVLEYIIDHAERVPKFDLIYEQQEKIGQIGYVVPLLTRAPFQRILLDFVGEIPLFYMLNDNPQLVEKLMALLDQLLIEDIQKLDDFKNLYIELPDNLDGVMTNPQLFKKYCLPYYKRYADLLHSQGKKVGTHADGNLKPILNLLVESNLDVCESFTPAPVTECTFEEAWNAWRDGPIIWGGIPSVIFDVHTSESKFHEYIHHLLQTVGDQPIILGVGDMVMGGNSIERVRYVANRVEEQRICP